MVKLWHRVEEVTILVCPVEQVPKKESLRLTAERLFPLLQILAKGIMDTEFLQIAIS